MDQKLAGYVSALSELDFHALPAQISRRYELSMPNERAIVTFLDGLALLLVSEAQGDVVAVTYSPLRKEHDETDYHEFLWAANQGGDEKKKRFLEEMVRMSDTGASIHQIIDSVLIHCWKKIIRRCRAVGKAFELTKEDIKSERYNFMGLTKQNERHSAMLKGVKASGLINSDTPFISTTDGFLRTLACIDRNTKPQVVKEALQYAYELSRATNLEGVLLHKQAKTLNKLGDYIRACRVWFNLHKQMQGGAIRKLTFTEILPLNQKKWYCHPKS